MGQVLALAVLLGVIGTLAVAACLWIEDKRRKLIAAEQAKMMGFRPH